TNLHSGQAQILQSAAIGALSDETHVEKMRKLYRKKRETLIPALREANFPKVYSEGTFYLWAKTPENFSSVSAVKKLLKEIGINSTPGSALAYECEDSELFLRFALVPSIEKTEEAAKRLKEEKVFE
ncbi:hypothetical protein AKJ64_04930, partial [candidate division MSBL1 archaeon SCGC-AAA259E17]